MARLVPQIDFGNYYKFVSSLGVGLILASAVVPWVFFRFDSVLRIPEREIESYSTVAEGVLRQRQYAISAIQFPWILLIFLALLGFGIFFLFRGSRQWEARQEVLNQTEDVHLEKFRVEIVQATSAEIEEEREREVEGDLVEPANTPSDSRQGVTAAASGGSRDVKEVENLDPMTQERGKEAVEQMLGSRRAYARELDDWLSKTLNEAYSGSFVVTSGAKVQREGGGRPLLIDATIDPFEGSSWGQVAFDIRPSSERVLSLRIQDSAIKMARAAVLMKGGKAYSGQAGRPRDGVLRAIQVFVVEGSPVPESRFLDRMEEEAREVNSVIAEKVGYVCIARDRLHGVSPEGFRDAVWSLWTGDRDLIWV